MLEPSPARGPRARPGFLPTRAADNLFWLGRYVERAEGIMRLLRAFHGRLAETPDPEAPLLAHLAATLEDYGIDPTATGSPACAAPSTARSPAPARCATASPTTAGWRSPTSPTPPAKHGGDRPPGDDAARAHSILLRKITGFSGLVHENMYRSRLALPRDRPRPRARPDHGGAARLPRRSRGARRRARPRHRDRRQRDDRRRHYAVATSRETVIDLLALDTLNPRAVHFQMSAMRAEIERLPEAIVDGQRSALARAVLKAETDLAIHTPETLDGAALAATATALAALSDLITDTYLR
jgi:uncharacterized alpha-E superfamily protein